MKHWPSQLFPIVLLALLAGLSFWLQKSVEQPETKHDGKFRHDADAIAENFVVRRFDETGQVKYRLSAPYMEHFPDDDTSQVRAPLLTSFRPDAPPMTLASDHAKMTAKGETVFFWDNVVATRTASPDRPAMVARMPDLTVQPNDGFAFTHSPVEITQENSWVKGVGMHIDNNTSTLELQSQVTGMYYRTRGPQ